MTDKSIKRRKIVHEEKLSDRCLSKDGRLSQLRRENAAASPEKQRHLERQILPGIAAYETLQTIMPREQALQTVHGYVERRARRQALPLRSFRPPAASGAST